eukprot:m51a1_g4448 hypothetical protein (873) ;mRNA; r:140358-143959
MHHKPLFLLSCSELLILLAVVQWAPGVSAFADDRPAFVHPGVVTTIDQLVALRAAVQAPGSNALKTWYLSNVARYKSYRMSGPFANVSRNPDVNLGGFNSDAKAIGALARVWGWGGAECPWIPGNAAEVIAGAEILRATYPGYTQATHELLRRYFGSVWIKYIPVGRSNPFGPLGTAQEQPVSGCGAGSHLWGGSQAVLELSAAMNVAVFTDDRLLFDETVSALLTDGTGGLPDTLPSGQVGDTGRDTGHAALEVSVLVDVAVTAWTQGVDLFSSYGSRLRNIVEFMSQRQLAGLRVSGVAEVPFVRFGSGFGMFMSLPPFDGVLRCIDQIAAALAVYTHKGLAMPHARAMVDYAARTSGYQLLFPVNVSTPQRYVPEPVFVEPPTFPVTDLTVARIGDLCVSGVARRVDTSTWFLSSGGIDSGWESMRGLVYAYTQVTGDFTFSAKVTSGCGQVLMMDAIVADGRRRPQRHARAALNERPNRAFNAFWGGGFDSYAAGNRAFYDGNFTSPMWLRLVRRGNFVYPSFSFDSVVWSPSANILYPATLPDTLLVGISVYMGNGTFTDVRLGNRTSSRPSAPTPKAEMARGSGSVRISWPAVANAVYYDVLRAEKEDGTFVAVAEKVRSASYVDTGMLELLVVLQLLVIERLRAQLAQQQQIEPVQQRALLEEPRTKRRRTSADDSGELEAAQSNERGEQQQRGERRLETVAPADSSFLDNFMYCEDYTGEITYDLLRSPMAVVFGRLEQQGTSPRWRTVNVDQEICSATTHVVLFVADSQEGPLSSSTGGVIGLALARPAEVGGPAPQRTADTDDRGAQKPRITWIYVVKSNRNPVALPEPLRIHVMGSAGDHAMTADDIKSAVLDLFEVPRRH